jgi:hypothetical protein
VTRRPARACDALRLTHHARRLRLIGAISSGPGESPPHIVVPAVGRDHDPCWHPMRGGWAHDEGRRALG